MRTKQIVLAAGLAASILTVGVGCSSSSDTTAPTTVASKSSSDDPTTSTGGGASPDDADVTLPASWPDALALPDDVVVIETTELAGGRSSVVVARVDGDPEATLDALETQLTDADWDVVSSDFTESPQGGYGGISATGRQYTVAITLGPDPTGDTTQVTINLAEKTST